MSNVDKEKQIILNLAGTLEGFINMYFKMNGFEIHDKNSFPKGSKAHFIIVRDHHEDWKSIETMYATIKNGTKIISLTPVNQVKTFIGVGGAAYIPVSMFKDQFYGIYLKRFFKNDISVHMDEAYGGTFLKYKSQKIINHVRSGFITDALTMEAFENEFNNIAIRGFVYNVIYYLTYLQQAQIASLPFDIEYAQNGKYFAVQMVASVKNFFAEYVKDSFGFPNIKNPVEFLLFEAHKLAPVLEITHVEKSNTIIITGLWQKVESEIIDNSFIFSQVKTVRKFYQEVEEKIESVQTRVEEIKKISSEKQNSLTEKKLAGKTIEKLDDIIEEKITKEVKEQLQVDAKDVEASEDAVERMLNKNDIFTQDVTNVKGKAVVDGENVKVSGVTDDVTEGSMRAQGGDGGKNDKDEYRIKDATDKLKEGATRVGGKTDEDSALTRVKGVTDKKTLGKMNVISGESTTEENDEVYKIGGGKGQASKKGQFNVIQSTETEEDNMDERFVHRFSQKVKGKNVEDKKAVVQEHISEFIADELPKIIKANGNNKIEDSLVKTIVENTGASEEQVKKLIDKGKKDFQNRSETSKSTAEADNFTEGVLLNKLKKKEDEVKQLNLKLEALKNQMSAVAIGQKKSQEIKKEIDDELKVQSLQKSEEIGSKAEYQKISGSTDIAKTIESMERDPSQKDAAELLKKLVTRESELVDLAKEHEVNLTKKEMEIKGLETSWQRELEKAEREVKNKEFIALKAKEAAKLAIEKKEKEVFDLKDRVSALSTKLNSSASVPQDKYQEVVSEKNDLLNEIGELKKKMVAVVAASKQAELKTSKVDNEEVSKFKTELIKTNSEKASLQTKNDNLMKALDGLKSKFEILNEKSKLPTENEEKLKTELTNLKNDLNETRKKLELQETKLQVEAQEIKDHSKDLAEKQLHTQIQTLKSEGAAQKTESLELKRKIQELENSLREAKMEAAMPPVQAPIANNLSSKSGVDQDKVNVELSKMIKEKDLKLSNMTEKVKELEARIQTFAKEKEKASTEGDAASKIKITQLEASLKKISADSQGATAALSESKKEHSKLKSENTALKNQVDKLKKDLERIEKKKAA